ncbi:hypothetical protein [Lactiplantibacillus plantarum]|nr:hypothetical protein [Lactiplantibacillus plantarum]
MEEKEVTTPFQVVVGDNQGDSGTCGPNGCSIADHWNKKKNDEKKD